MRISLCVTPHIIFWSDFSERRWFEKAIFVGISFANEGFKLYLNGVNYNDVTMETFSLNYTHFYVLTTHSHSAALCGRNISVVCTCFVKSVFTSGIWREKVAKILINSHHRHGLPIINIFIINSHSGIYLHQEVMMAILIELY